MRLITPWKYNLLAPLIPARIKPFLREWVMSRSVIRGFYPVPETPILGQVIKPEDTVIDIGANIGAYSRVFAGLAQKVIAIEPVTPTFKILLKSTADLKNVIPLKFALSDHEGPEYIRMLPADETVGEISLFKSTLEPIWQGNSSTDVKEEVTLRTLDSFHFKPNFIKCDCEGHDWKVIQGSDETTRKHRPIWLVEIMEYPLDSPIYKYFKKLKYKCFIQNGEGLRELYREFSPTQNYFFVSQ